MTSLLDDASLPTDAPGLEAEIVILDEKLAASNGEIRRLMAAEDPAQGVFHAAAIHEAKQLCMMLRYQKDLRTVRLAQLRSALQE